MTKTFDAKADPGTVLRTSPTVGGRRPGAAAVTLTVADSITVPDVRGKSTNDATAAMRDAGFSVSVGDPAFDPASTPATSCAPTRVRAPGSTAPAPRCSWCRPTRCRCPDLSDLTVKDAERKLDDLGLRLDVTSLFGGDNGTVWNQSPGPGERVAPGGTVAVVVLR